VKAGANNGDAVKDLLVEHCTFRHGHGCSIGSETGAGVQNMTVRDCTFDGTDIGVRFKSDRSRGGVVHHVTYEPKTGS
jgi:polygalacturonase